ncbi:MAG: hypothetical protein WC477_07625 [Patescibacteria group bacterium]
MLALMNEKTAQIKKAAKLMRAKRKENSKKSTKAATDAIKARKLQFAISSTGGKARFAKMNEEQRQAYARRVAKASWTPEARARRVENFRKRKLAKKRLLKKMS